MEDVVAHKGLVRNFKFWIPVFVSVPVTFILAVISAGTAGLGFANYDAAMVFFPYMMLSILWFGIIHPVIGVAALFQPHAPVNGDLMELRRA